MLPIYFIHQFPDASHGINSLERGHVLIFLNDRSPDVKTIRFRYEGLTDASGSIEIPGFGEHDRQPAGPRPDRIIRASYISDLE